jgi:23S rRNA (guanosine2251-2'-O)-methyltransferase
MSKQNQWIVGINAVAAAVEHDAGNVREVLVEAGGKNPRLTEIEQSARRRDIDVRRVAQQALDGVAGGVRHQGVAARYAAAKTWNEDDLADLVEQAGGRALLLVLDGVQDPHNLGACLRSAAAAGATAVVIPKDKAVQVNATVRKTSAGAADSIPVVRATNLARCLADLQKMGVWIYGLVGEADASVYALDLTGNVALVLGGEADGLRRLTREHCDQLVSIPMPGVQNAPGVESLNVSVASGVTLFEANVSPDNDKERQSMSLNLQWYDWVGLAGTLMVLGAFFLLQARRLSGTGIVYQLLNLFGAVGILVSLYGSFNVSVFFLQVAWVLISGYGIARGLSERNRSGG